jgi:ATP-binding cassette subfamily B protein
MGGAWHASKRRLLFASGLLFLGGLSGPFIALGLRQITNSSLSGNLGGATLAGAVVGVLVLCDLTFGHFAHFFFFELADLYSVSVNQELMQLSNGSLGIEQHERAEYSDKLELLRNEFNHLWGSVEQVFSSIGLVTAMLMTGIILAGLSPLLLLLPLFALPPLLGGRWANERVDRARVASAGEIRLGRHLLYLAFDADAAKEIRLFGIQDELARREEELWTRVTRRLWRAELGGIVLQMAGQLLFAAGYVGAVLLVVKQTIDGHGSVGNVVLVVALAAQVNAQVAQVLNVVQQLQRTSKAVTRLLWLRAFSARLHPVVSDPAPVPERLQRGIALHGVSFRYPATETDVLRDVELEIPPGTTVAIVGENGAGKSTLVKLLCRFYEPTTGSITLDGVDLRRFDADDWRLRIAAGFQDFYRFELIARESVGVGGLELGPEEHPVLAALDRAHATDVVGVLPEGLATQLGKSYADGSELSGGQWQKVALGRAMMRETPLLLILDEPTSALDAHAEHALFERYAATARAVGTATGAVTVFVSHRFSTVRMADLILVIRDGEIAERGSHGELMELGGTYAELFELQAAAYR